MAKITINLENYNNLSTLAKTKPEKFQKMIQGMLNLTNEHYHIVEQAVGMPIHEFTNATIEAFTDYRGILSNHKNRAEAEMMEALGHENNPVAVLQGKAQAYDAYGNPVNPKDFFNETDYKDWLQGLLYGARYMDRRALAQYMSLKEFDLVDYMKMNNVQQLLKIQPALDYQKEKSITPGKRMKGTGFFYCGNHKGKGCTACKSENVTYDDEKLFCLDCKAAFDMGE